MKVFSVKHGSVAESCPQRDISIVRGDFNVISSCDRAGYELPVSPHAESSIKNSFLRDFARSRKLRITGFWYEHSSPHHWTWYSNIGAVVKVNHILVSGYFRTAGFTVIDWPWLPYGSTSKSTKSPVSTLGVFHLDRQESGVCPWVCCCISNRFVVLKHL